MVGALERLESREASPAAARLSLDPAARRLVGAMGAALGLDLASTRLVVTDPTGASADLVDAVMAALAERVDATVIVPPGETHARQVRRAHLIRGWSLATGPEPGDPVLAVARYPHPLRPRMSAVDILTAVDNVQLDLASGHRAVVIAPASILCDPLGDADLEARRDSVLRLGRLRCAVRLPKGLVTGNPRQALGLWVLGPEVPGPLDERMLSTADVSDERLSPAVIDDLVSDALASTGLWESKVHAFRFARPARASVVLAGQGALVPGRRTTGCPACAPWRRGGHGGADPPGGGVRGGGWPAYRVE